MNCSEIIHCLEVSCKEDILTTDGQTVNYYSTIHALELIFLLFAIALKKSCNSWTVSHMFTYTCNVFQWGFRSDLWVLSIYDIIHQFQFIWQNLKTLTTKTYNTCVGLISRKPCLCCLQTKEQIRLHIQG